MAPFDVLNFCLSDPGNKNEGVFLFRLRHHHCYQRGDATEENVSGMCCEKVSAATEGIVVRAFGGGGGGGGGG